MQNKLKVIFIDVFGNTEKREMLQAPRIGDTVPVFHSRGEVTKVVWFPDILDEKLFSGVDVLVTLD